MQNYDNYGRFLPRYRAISARERSGFEQRFPNAAKMKVI
jgi:hypothetical protein